MLAAIDRGARTMDGVKFRTRAGMGRCQGGFCAWRVMSLLAAATDVPITAVTKKGGGSWIARDRTDAIERTDVAPRSAGSREVARG